MVKPKISMSNACALFPSCNAFFGESFFLFRVLSLVVVVVLQVTRRRGIAFFSSFWLILDVFRIFY
jgi:hypothetical protein